MNARCSLVFLVVSGAACTLLGGCGVYDRHTGDYPAGSVDPAKFPAEFLGTGGSGSKPGSGYFLPAAAHVGGKPLQNGTAQGYFPFAFTGPQSGADDPLLLGGDKGLQVPLGYVFDPNPSALPGPAKGLCVGPAGYKFQQQTDAVHYDQQGSILTDLPDDTAAYVPLVQEDAVTSDGEDCQSIVDEQTLLQSPQVVVPTIPPDPTIPNSMAAGKGDGKYLAWAIIDPAAAVFLTPNDDTGNTMAYVDGLQSWGWYNHFLTAYLDGGYVITMDTADGAEIVPQKLYYPTLVPDGKGGTKAGKPSMGYDILQQARTLKDSGGNTTMNPQYTPVCELWSFEPVNPLSPLTDEQQVLVAANATKVTDTGTAIYCIQLYSTQQQP